MGGYVGQAYAQLFPEKLHGFVSIDSAPLQREYVTSAEIWLLKRMEPVYRHFSVEISSEDRNKRRGHVRIWQKPDA